MVVDPGEERIKNEFTGVKCTMLPMHSILRIDEVKKQGVSKVSDFEGTNVSEGRGTTRPFELIGAPWVIAERFAEAMNRRDLPGVYFRPAVFEPTFQKHAGIACAGVQPHVLDRQTFRAVEAGVALIEAFRASDPNQFRWKDPPYEYEFEKMPIDCLAGSSTLREQIDGGVAAHEIAASWTDPVAVFKRARANYLLY